MPSAADASIATLLLRHSRRQLSHVHQTHDSNSNHSSSQHVSPRDDSLLHWHYSEFDDRNFQIHGQTLLYMFILFSIILLATLLLLYARWFFRLRHLPSSLSSSNAAISTATARPSLPQLIIPIPRPAPLPPPPASRGLDWAAINAIPIILHQSSEVTDGKIQELECCICLGMFEDGDKVKVLPSCCHRYHCACVDAWIRDHSNCPLCRLPIRVDPPV